MSQSPSSQPRFSTLRFVNASGQSQDGGRKQIATRACDECRRKKKRCKHVSPDALLPLPLPSDSSSSLRAGQPNIPLRAPHVTTPTPTSTSTSNSTSTSTSAPESHAGAWRPLTNDGDSRSRSSFTAPAASAGSALLPLPLPQSQGSHGPTQSAYSALLNNNNNNNNNNGSHPPGASIEETRKRQRTSSHQLQERFVGDLNPEVELLKNTAAALDTPRQNGVGLWHHDADAREHADSSSGRDYFSSASLFHGCSPETKTLLQPILEEQCLKVMPPKSDFAELSNFYFKRIHLLLPAIDEEAYAAEAPDSPTHIIQSQIICLLAAANPAMNHHLKLPASHLVLSPAVFARHVLDSMRLTIELGLISDKTIIIRALAIMSLSSYGRHNLELSSQFFARAVHLGGTIGLHQPRDPQRDKRVSGLFCLVWSIDRIHAAILGRPVLMHEVDMGKSVLTCAQERSSGFRVLVHIAVLLDMVISLYRPNAVASEIPDRDFPLFEEVVVECGATHIPTDLLTTLELFYNAVGILSCRHKAGDVPVRNSRQDALALQIISIIDVDVAAPVWLPFIPYAVSMSLSTACRELRHSSVVTRQSRAAQRISKCCSHLQAFGSVFWGAAFMSELGLKILHDGNHKSVSHNLATSKSYPSVLTLTAEDPTHQNSVDDGANMLDLIDPAWNLDELEGLLQSNLDPSLPSFLQDLDFTTGV